MQQQYNRQKSPYFVSIATIKTNTIKTATTSHASVAYHKQLPPQRTVGTIGGEWRESTSSKETTRRAQTSPQSTENQPIA